MHDDKQDKEKSFDFKGKKKEKLKARISKLNRIYEKQGMQIRIVSNGRSPWYESKRISVVDIEKEDEEVSNFLFYPKSKSFEFNDQGEKKPSGYKICFVKLMFGFNSNTVIEETLIELSNKELETGAWIEKKELKPFNLKKQSYDPRALMKTMLDNKKNYKNEIVVSSAIGWVKAGKQYHYVPITNSKKGSVKNTKDFNRTFKCKIDEDMTGIESYQKMKELLQVTKPEITIPLISYTVLSSFKSLYQKHCKEHKEFMFCIYGENEQNKEILANLFCNIFNRTSLYSIDPNLHVDQGQITDISEKAKKLRDAIFISKVNKPNEAKSLSKLLKKDGFSAGLLLISPTQIKDDQVINIDIYRAKVDKTIIEYHEKNPATFSTWFVFFIEFFQTILQDKKWNNELYRVYKKCKKLIAGHSQGVPNIGRLEQCAWLLTGYRIFEEFGLEVGAITKEDQNLSLIDATAVFNRMCVINGAGGEDQTEKLEEREKYHIPAIPEPSRFALAYLYAVDKVLNFNNVVSLGDGIPEGQDYGGWHDKKMLYLRNTETYEVVIDYLREYTDVLLEASGTIYTYLHEEKGIISKKRKDGYGVPKTGAIGQVIHLNIQKSKEFLNEHGFELNFFKNL